jgi:predicted phage tail protein
VRRSWRRSGIPRATPTAGSRPGRPTTTVSAVNAVGEGSRSNERSATVWSRPGAPALASANGLAGGIALTWNAPSANGGSAITGYRVYRGASPGGETVLTTVGNVTTYTDTTVANARTYYYRVAAVNAVGEGAPSNELSAKRGH